MKDTPSGLARPVLDENMENIGNDQAIDVSRIITDDRSSIPLYLQIKDQIIEQILENDNNADMQLPTVRNLANKLSVSVITTKRVYEELVNSRFCYSVPGKGYFIQPKNSLIRIEATKQQIEGKLDEVIKIAYNNDINLEELVELLRTLWDLREEEENDNSY